MTAFIVEPGSRRPRSPWDTIAIVGLAAKGDGAPTLIRSLTEAIAKYGERLSLYTGLTKTIRNYGLVDAIETILSYVQVPIIAINAAAGATATPVTAKSYVLNAQGKIKLDDPNVVAPITVTNAGATVTYTSPADYTLDAVKGEITRTGTGTIPATAGTTVSVGYSVVNFSAAVDWITAIGMVAPIANNTPTIIITAGVDMTAPIATALSDRSLALGGITVYTQPGVSPASAVQLTTSPNAIAVYPLRNNPDRGFEESSAHFVGALALLDYWESPNGQPLKSTTVAVSVADTALLLAKNISLGSDRIQEAIATNGVAINIARLRAKAQFLANKVADAWRLKPWDLVHIEAIGQAIRNVLNLEPQASNLPYCVVNFNSGLSSMNDRKLVYDLILKGGNASDRIALITVFVR
jgi:hypothetical protein